MPAEETCEHCKHRDRAGRAPDGTIYCNLLNGVDSPVTLWGAGCPTISVPHDFWCKGWEAEQ